jgi:hypothetical protein
VWHYGSFRKRKLEDRTVAAKYDEAGRRNNRSSVIDWIYFTTCYAAGQIGLPKTGHSIKAALGRVSRSGLSDFVFSGGRDSSAVGQKQSAAALS